MVGERQMKLVSKPFFEQQNVVFFSKQEKNNDVIIRGKEIRFKFIHA